MASKEEVLSFLRDFNVKANIWGIVFLDDRAKNSKALALLEISPIERKQIIKELHLHDFSDGPIKDGMNIGGDLWVFGKMVKNQEVYIKISMGFSNNPTICISFHLSEYTMIYPYKTI
ncbi:hypothetical protein [Emticicia soli]|uniref:Toxin n=1 Tax=Emticicia soli TaxID=2027878 RepID=A0ABW5JCS2_9BACT